MATTKKTAKKKTTRGGKKSTKKASTRRTSASKTSKRSSKTTKKPAKSRTSSPAVPSVSHLSHGVAGETLPPGTVLLDPNNPKIKTAARKERFIISLAEHGNVTLAAHCAGWKSRNAAYYHQKEDELFAALWQEAEDIACDALEMKARERAIGWDEPIVNKDGEVVGQRRCYSDKMMEMMLKANRREKYGDKVDHEVTHGGGVIVIPQPLDAKEFEQVVFDQQKRHRDARVVSEQ